MEGAAVEAEVVEGKMCPICSSRNEGQLSQKGIVEEKEVLEERKENSRRRTRVISYRPLHLLCRIA